MNEPEDIRVQLARIEGKQDVTNERLDTANRINDERYASVRNELSNHAGRITGLEGREREREGERKGLATSGRLLWAAVGFAPGAVVAVLKLAGV